MPHQAHLPALVGDTHADAALGELVACGLVSPVGARHRLAAGVPAQLEAAGYADDADARVREAAQHYAWWTGHPSVTPERVCAESDAILAALTALSPLAPDTADEPGTAVRLARTAAPAFASGLHWSAWERALRAGAEAARIAGDVGEQAYFHHELGIHALCAGQLDRARAELEASIGLRGALADKRGTVAGRRALALVADRSGVPLTLAPTAAEEVPEAHVEESASPPRGVPMAFPDLQPPADTGLVVSRPVPAATVPQQTKGGVVGGLKGLARRNLVAAGAGALLVAVLGTVVTLGATSGNDPASPSGDVGVNPSASQGLGDGELDADPAAGNKGDTGKATSCRSDPGPPTARPAPRTTRRRRRTEPPYVLLGRRQVAGALDEQREAGDAGPLAGRGEPVGAQPRGAHRVQPAQQLGVGQRVAHPPLPAVHRHVCLQPLFKPAGHRLQQDLGRVRAPVRDLADPGRDMGRALDLGGRPAAGARVTPPQGDHLGLLLVADVHAEQHRQPALGGQPDARGGGAGDHDLRALGLGERLRRAGHDGHLPEPVPFAVRAHGRLAQPAQQQVERLREPLLVRLQAGREDLQVHPRAAAAEAQREPAAAGDVQQRGLFAERDRVDGGQHTDRRAHAQPPGAAEQQRRQGDGGRAGAVGHEVVLGQPDRVEPRLLGHFGGADRAVQRLTLALPGEPGGQHETSNAHCSSCFLGSDAELPRRA
ncbi:hypothetical protein SALBM217S_05794 [Streptomyces griseoloalbus]